MSSRSAGGRPRVGVVGGSRSDFPILERATALLTELGSYELVEGIP